MCWVSWQISTSTREVEAVEVVTLKEEEEDFHPTRKMEEAMEEEQIRPNHKTEASNRETENERFSFCKVVFV